MPSSFPPCPTRGWNSFLCEHMVISWEKKKNKLPREFKWGIKKELELFWDVYLEVSRRQVILGETRLGSRWAPKPPRQAEQGSSDGHTAARTAARTPSGCAYAGVAARKLFWGKAPGFLRWWCPGSWRGAPRLQPHAEWGEQEHCLRNQFCGPAANGCSVHLVQNQMKGRSPSPELGGEQLWGPLSSCPAVSHGQRGTGWKHTAVFKVTFHKVKRKYNLNSLISLNFPFWDYKSNIWLILLLDCASYPDPTPLWILA